ncbi:MAG TPA: serine hydrolase domain-containing protein [Blastocatellia bacterium]|nr:serine hydrolase domain-containing protein [Blastocatellia bacterium]
MLRDDANGNGLAKKVDALFAEWDKPDSPGCALAVIKDSKIIYKRGYGMADLERNVPITPSSVFDIGSTSKQFSAMCLLLLAKQGKISLDDDIRKYVPEMPKYDAPITIRHLIHHTSGIRDYLTLLALAGLPFENDYPDDEVIALIARQKELNFKPGDEHLYSNSGYFLMSVIVKRASGKSLREYADENIFKPLGMKNTHFHDDYTMIVKNRAIGYSPAKAGGFRIDMSIFDVVGDGALMTSVEDLFLWDQNFYANKLGGGGQELINETLRPGVLNSGKKLEYAVGLTVSDYRGLRMVSHGGAWAGYRAEMIRFPEQRFSVICLSNLGTFNPTRMAKKVADIYLADHLKPETGVKAASPAAPARFIALPEAALKEKTGIFKNRASGAIWNFTLQDGKLMAAIQGLSFPISPVSETAFHAVGAPVDITFTFEKPAGGKPTQIRVVVGDQPPEVLEPVGASTLTPERLNEYAGQYYSDELDVTYNVFVKDDKLRLKLRHDPEEPPFEPLDEDAFSVRGVKVKFTRDDQKRVTGFSVQAGRVKNIRFQKRTA